jgi:O-antigen ligase
LTTDSRAAVETTGPSGPVLFWLAAALLVFAPLVRGGNRPAPLFALEMAALATLAWVAWARGTRLRAGQAPAALRIATALVFLMVVVQMVPLPPALWASLPGHKPYVATLAAAGIEPAWRPASIHPLATQYAALATLPCVAIFVLVQEMDRQGVRRLVTVFIAFAIAEAALGVLQMGAGPTSLLQLGNPWGLGSATGTYVNKNHFAGFLAMALPLVLAYWSLHILPRVDDRGEPLRLHPRSGDARIAWRIALSMALVVALAALLFTRSRAGIGTGILALAAAAMALFWRNATMQARGVLAAIAILGAMLAAYVGLTPMLERFSPEEVALGAGGRARLSAAALRASLDFMPLGSGLGTFADVFRRYQADGLPGFIDHAHNDYAEALLELGIAGAAAIVLALAAYAMRWRELRPHRSLRSLAYFQVAAGFGMLAAIVHAAFDFNFHIPGNAVVFSFLAAVFFYDSRREHATPDADPA